jgi:hypothetical protein
MPVAIFGDRSCGKTVFLSLLYESQVRYANLASNKGIGEFKFTTEPQFARVMGDIRNDLMQGNWADSTLKGTLSKYSFKYGFRKAIPGGTSPSEKFQILDFTVYDIAGEDLDILRSLDAFSKTAQSGDKIAEFDFSLVSDSFRKLLDCNVFVFLLDLSRLNAKPRTDKHREMKSYDIFMATLISAISKYKSIKFKKDEEQSKIYPVFIMTKFDVLDKKILEGLKIPTTYKDLGSGGWLNRSKISRKEYCDIIMRNFYQDTMALAKGGALMNISFDKAGFFFSQVATELNQDGEEIPKMINIQGVPMLAYSDSEYQDFIDYFRIIVKKMADGELDAQEFRRD